MDEFGYDDEGITAKKMPDKSDMQKLEELILPLIQNLIDTSDRDTIKWPKRREPLEKLKDDILKITRG